MADYFEPTIIQQSIPDADMTPLERLLLSRIFECEPDGNGCYFFAQESPSTMIFARRAELEAALASSPDIESAAHRYVTEQLASADANATEIHLDLSGTSWEFFLCRHRHNRNYAEQRVMPSSACNLLAARREALYYSA